MFGINRSVTEIAEEITHKNYDEMRSIRPVRFETLNGRHQRGRTLINVHLNARSESESVHDMSSSTEQDFSSSSGSQLADSKTNRMCRNEHPGGGCPRPSNMAPPLRTLHVVVNRLAWVPCSMAKRPTITSVNITTAVCSRHLHTRLVLETEHNLGGTMLQEV